MAQPSAGTTSSSARGFQFNRYFPIRENAIDSLGMIGMPVRQTNPHKTQVAFVQHLDHDRRIVGRIDQQGLTLVMNDVALYTIAADRAVHRLDPVRLALRDRLPFVDRNLRKRLTPQTQRIGKREEFRSITRLLSPFQRRDYSIGQPGPARDIAGRKPQTCTGFFQNVTAIVFKRHDHPRAYG